MINLPLCVAALCLNSSTIYMLHVLQHAVQKCSNLHFVDSSSHLHNVIFVFIQQSLEFTSMSYVFNAARQQGQF